MILALRALGVGDLAAAVPALRALRAAYPEEILALATSRWLAPLVELIGGVDRLIPVDGLTGRSAAALVNGLDGLAAHAAATDGPLPATDGPLGAGGGPLAAGGARNEAVRLAVNLHGRGPQSHWLLRRVRPQRMLAFACPLADHRDGPSWQADEHEVGRWCRLLTWYGIPTDPTDLALRQPVERHLDGLTIVHPGGKSPARRWPVERFADVARVLSADGHRVVVTGSAGDRELAEGLAGLAGLPAGAVLAGQTDLGTLAGLVAGARVLISSDTGIAHLATGYRTPSVVLFGPVSPRHWGPPPGRPWHRVLWHGDLAGQPMTRGAHPALWAIEVADVLAEVTEAERYGRRRRYKGWTADTSMRPPRWAGDVHPPKGSVVSRW